MGAVPYDPGRSRRHGPFLAGNAAAVTLEVDPATTSRVELEPYGAKLARQGRTADVETIRAELAARVWQNHNPYANGWPLPIRKPPA